MRRIVSEMVSAMQTHQKTPWTILWLFVTKSKLCSGVESQYAESDFIVLFAMFSVRETLYLTSCSQVCKSALTGLVVLTAEVHAFKDLISNGHRCFVFLAQCLDMQTALDIHSYIATMAIWYSYCTTIVELMFGGIIDRAYAKFEDSKAMFAIKHGLCLTRKLFTRGRK